MARFPLIGPGYTLASIAADCQRCVNWYPEVNETGLGRGPLSMKRKPGIKLFANLGAGPIRGMWAGENRLFAVSGGDFYEIFADGSSNNRGSVGNDGQPVRIISNGAQLLIASAGRVYCDNGTGPALAKFSVGSGTVNVGKGLAGTCDVASVQDPPDANVSDVTLASGDSFPKDAATITIDGNEYPIVDGSSDGESLQIVGTLDTSGSNWSIAGDPKKVTWASGDFFDAGVGDQIIINGHVLIVTTVTDDMDITVNEAIGPLNNVPWSGFGVNGRVNAVAIGGGSYAVFLESGDEFPPTLLGEKIRINTAEATVTVVNSPKAIVVTGIPVAMNDVPYGAIVPVPAFQATYLDGYAIVCQPSSKVLFVSANFDFTSWDASATAVKEAYPDNIAAILADHQQLYVFGDENSGQVFQDVGNVDFPFAPNQNMIIHWACRAPWSLTRFDNGIAWIAGDQERGGPFVFYTAASIPKRISTHAIEQTWAKYSKYNDAVTYSRVEDGHQILIVSFPTARTTWAYDATASAQIGVPCWHERAYGDNLDRDRGAFHAFVGLSNDLPEQSYLGDWQNGKIYYSRMDLTTDDGVAITRIRTAPHFPTDNDNRRTKYRWTEALFDLGPNGDSISPVLDYSRDGGYSFVNPKVRTTSPGLTNIRLSRFIWRRQGAIRSRVVRLKITDATPFTLVDAYSEYTPLAA